jgi:beta-ribofuranosylaminobenzene 5'-phosphate synthase
LDLRASLRAAGVTVRVPARLHLGFLDLSRGQARRFGGIGLAISELETQITITRALEAEVTGPERARAADHVATMLAHLRLAGAHRVSMQKVVPAHAGLGSGTQIALAVAAGLRRLSDRPLDVEGDAMRLGRGARSGLGIGLFADGGLVVDGGRSAAARPPPIVSRLAFPEEWRIILVLDPTRQGINGPSEATAFAALEPYAAARAAENCRLVLLQALPALVERDLKSFGAAIGELQVHIGDYFAPVQGGGRFLSPAVAAALQALAQAGACGLGQSSWGPTGFAFVGDAARADAAVAALRADERFAALDIRVCRGLNHGAQIDLDPGIAARGPVSQRGGAV